MKIARNFLALALAAALFAVPATALGAKGGQGKSKKGGQHKAKGMGKSKGQGKAKSCAKTHTVGFQVGGTLVSVMADDAATTDASEATVTLTVTSANSHARKSGELVGETYTVPVGDAYELKLGDDGTAVPAAGDRVKVKGRIAVTKKRCAAEGASVADRYDTPDVTRVKISKPEVEVEVEAEVETETEVEVPPAV
jgi:hypothetical protein